jgi:GntR family transcriptional regulator
MSEESKLNRDSPQPLFLQLQNLLRGQIDEGSLAPGDRISSEHELSREHGISRMTARRALDTLVMEGLLFRRPGKGTYVSEKVQWPGATIFSFSTAMTSLGLTVTTRVVELTLAAATANIARDLGVAPGDQIVRLARLRRVEGEPVALHTSYMGIEYYPAILHADLVTTPLNKVMEQIRGRLIVNSRDYVEVTLARPEEATLLEIPEGAPLLLVRGLVFSDRWRPERATKSLFRGDRFRFTIEGGTLQVKAPNWDSSADGTLQADTGSRPAGRGQEWPGPRDRL